MRRQTPTALVIAIYHWTDYYGRCDRISPWRLFLDKFSPTTCPSLTWTPYHEDISARVSQPLFRLHWRPPVARKRASNTSRSDKDIPRSLSWRENTTRNDILSNWNMLAHLGIWFCMTSPKYFQSRRSLRREEKQTGPSPRNPWEIVYKERENREN